MTTVSNIFCDLIIYINFSPIVMFFIAQQIQENQKTLLLELVEDSFGILFGRRVANGLIKRKQRWAEISVALNAIAVCK